MSRFQRLRELFERAVDLPPAEVGTFLRTECAGDNELLDEVWGMLAAHFAAQSHGDTTEGAETASLMGQFVGPYCIQDQIGAGGMGSVYEAVRADGAFRKRVALKVLRRQMVNDELVTRFHNERQVLANLDHPNIARILDGGQTADGRPYYAMEFVDGIPLDRFCVERGLEIGDRLRLFQQLCRAVHYLHENRVIHRDLKPSNVLVTAAGAIKLLDFGIAKAEYPMPEGEMLRSARLMTPDYASPEQLSGTPTTRASDIYSLGVILYQLVCRRLPQHDLTPEGDRAVYTGVSTALDRVAGKCLRRNPAHRYSSAGELAEELEPLIEGHAREPGALRTAGGRWVAALAAAAAVFVIWQIRGPGLLLFGVVAAAGLLSLLLLRWPDLSIAASGQRTRDEERRVEGGLLRSLLVEAVAFVPAGSALAWLTLRPLLLRAVQAFGGAVDGGRLGAESLMLHAIAGMAGYAVFVAGLRALVARMAGRAVAEPAEGSRAAAGAVWFAERAGWLNALDRRRVASYLAAHGKAFSGPWRDAAAMALAFAAMALVLGVVFWSGSAERGRAGVEGPSADVETVIELVKQGVPEHQIVSSIRARGRTAPLTPRELLKLHEAKVPAGVIDALLEAAPGSGK